MEQECGHANLAGYVLAFSSRNLRSAPKWFSMKLDAFTVSGIRQTVRTILCNDFSSFSQEDQLVVEQRIGQVRIYYSCERAAGGCPATTFLECWVDLNSNEMWIGNLHVATACRMRGLGRSLVQVAAKIAAAFEMREINVFPLQGSLDFWRKMGYERKPCTARVLYKDVVVGRDVVVRVNESQDLCREARCDSLHTTSHI